MTIKFIMLFTLLAFAATGTGMMYLLLIKPGQLFSFMQPALVYMSKKTGLYWEFLYKSLGGCEVCTIQRFVDLTFILMVCISKGVQWWLWPILYVLFGGLSFYATSLIFTRNQQLPPPEINQDLKL